MIEGMGKRELPDALNDRFMRNIDSYDFFLKLDADRVIEDQRFLLRISKWFAQACNQEVQQLMIGLLVLQ